MAKKKNGVNKSEEVRRLLKANPEITAKEVSAALAEKGLKISGNLYYFIKGQMKGRKGRKKKAQKMVANVAATTGSGSADALSVILKVKSVANEVGGLKKLKAIIDALSE
jgi:hypothetical protein